MGHEPVGRAAPRGGRGRGRGQGASRATIPRRASLPNRGDERCPRVQPPDRGGDAALKACPVALIRAALAQTLHTLACVLRCFERSRRARAGSRNAGKRA